MVTAGRWGDFCHRFSSELKEGEIVIVNPHVEAKSNDYVIVKNDEEEATFKRLKIYGETTVLHPLNQKYPDIELRRGDRYHIVGKPYEHKQELDDSLNWQQTVITKIVTRLKPTGSLCWQAGNFAEKRKGGRNSTIFASLPWSSPASMPEIMESKTRKTSIHAGLSADSYALL